MPSRIKPILYHAAHVAIAAVGAALLTWLGTSQSQIAALAPVQYRDFILTGIGLVLALYHQKPVSKP